MTTRHYTLEELQNRKEQTTQRIAAYEQRMKRIAAKQRRLAKQIAAQAESERRSRLLARGELLESLVPFGEQLTDEQLRSLLTHALQQESVRELLARITNEPEGGTPYENQPHL